MGLFDDGLDFHPTYELKSNIQNIPLASRHLLIKVYKYNIHPSKLKLSSQRSEYEFDDEEHSLSESCSPGKTKDPNAAFQSENNTEQNVANIWIVFTALNGFLLHRIFVVYHDIYIMYNEIQTE